MLPESVAHSHMNSVHLVFSLVSQKQPQGRCSSTFYHSTGGPQVISQSSIMNEAYMEARALNHDTADIVLYLNVVFTNFNSQHPLKLFIIK